MISLRCSACRALSTLPDDEEFRQDSARCETCGKVGTLRCNHARTALDECLDCHMDFSEGYEEEPDDL